MKYYKASFKTKIADESLEAVHTHTHTGCLINKNKGITIISLIVTIIVLLILAGISIATLTSDNGIIKQSKSAKENTEISEEKEIVEKSATEAMGKNKRGNLVKNELEQQLKNNTNGKTTLYDDDENIIVEFNESKRVYSVDKDGNVNKEDSTILAQDKTPGTMDGTGKKDDPYVIMSIEDLVGLSQEASKGTYVALRERFYIELGRDLNFNSDLSYCDKNTKEYNEFLGVSDDVGLKEALTNRKYSGFKPIITLRNHTFLGNNHSIKNLYQHVESDSGLFNNSWTSIENLTLTGEIICEGDYAGGLVSGQQSANGNIVNCVTDVNIKSNGENAAGIFAGASSSCEIKNCINYGDIEGNNRVSGIACYWQKISNCKNYGNVKGNNLVGGISACHTTIENCSNYGKVDGVSNVGGISGQHSANIPISKIYNYGDIKGETYVGGLYGNASNNDKSIINGINYGNVEGNTAIGGITGYITGCGILANCANFGNVKGEKFVSGICGQLCFTQAKQNELFNCYTIGNVEGTMQVGGVTGVKNGYGTHYIKNCYWKKSLNLECCPLKTAGELKIEDSEEFEDSYFKTQEFVNLLNENAKKYNQENSEDANFGELMEWKFINKSEYPIFE